MQSFRKDLTVKVTVSFDKEIEDKILYLLRQTTKFSDESKITEQVKLTFSSLRKAFEKQTKIIKDHREKQAKPTISKY